MRLREAVVGLAAAAGCACSNAVSFGPNSVMVPLVQPVQGCRAYRLVVEGGYAPTVVYFRRADGSFTKDRSQAACPGPEPQVGG